MTRDVFNGSGGTQVRFIIGLDLSKQDDRSPCTWEHDMEFFILSPNTSNPTFQIFLLFIDCDFALAEKLSAPTLVSGIPSFIT